jgi:hypothetical protein
MVSECWHSAKGSNNKTSGEIMKARILPVLFVTGSLVLLDYTANNLRAQSSPNEANPPAAAQAVPAATTTPLPPATSAPPPQLSYGAEEVLKLTQAKIGEDTMRTFVESSHLNYDLDALSIIYLRQQGVPETVVTAMLQKSKEVADDAKTATSPPAATANAVVVPQTPAPVPQPDATYSQPAPDYSSTYPAYAQPSYDYYDYYPYPYYDYSYPVGFYFGYGYGYHGYRGYNGGGFHGGEFHGSGNFHGSAAFHGTVGTQGSPTRNHH